MAAGPLRERLALVFQDDLGAGHRAVKEVGFFGGRPERPARIESVSGDDGEVSGGREGVGQYKITLRRDAETARLDSTSELHDLRADRYFEIRTVLADERSRWVMVICEARAR